MGIIHMNGRIYDPRLGRFLQADPLIEDTSTLNRYTYVHNNPLAYTDPSGHFSVGQLLRTVAVVAISVWTGGALSGATWAILNASAWTTAAKFALVVASGAVSGAIQSGTIEGAAWGAFSAAVFFGIGQGLADAGPWAKGDFLGTELSGTGFAVKTVSHGLAGGTLSRLQGGKFGHGFVSAAGSAASAPFADLSSAKGAWTGAVVSTVIGGTLSKLSGGKFANGAVTAAMSYAFARIGSSDAECADCQGGIGKPVGARHQLDRINPAWRDKLSVVQEDGVTVIRGHLTVSGPGAAYVAHDVTAVWGNASGEFDGVTYRTEISMSAVKSGGDWLIQSWKRADWMRLNAKLCSGVAGVCTVSCG
jgi:hypothetical protein